MGVVIVCAKSNIKISHHCYDIWKFYFFNSPFLDTFFFFSWYLLGNYLYNEYWLANEFCLWLWSLWTQIQIEVPSHEVLMTNLEQNFWLRDSLFCRIKGNLLSSFSPVSLRHILFPRKQILRKWVWIECWIWDGMAEWPQLVWNTRPPYPCQPVTGWSLTLGKMSLSNSDNLQKETLWA